MKVKSSERRIRRHKKVRNSILGDAVRHRLSVFRSGQHIYGQIIDDTKNLTIAYASDIDKELKIETKDNKKALSKTDKAKAVGTLLAKRSIKKKIKKVVFDRGGFAYIGRVRALAEAARAEGLEF